MTDADLEVRAGLTIPAGELVETASRSSGPGGQHVNKSSTRVTLRWSVAESDVLDDALRARLLERLGARLTRSGELVVHADRSRSRARNLEQARERLAELVAQALRVRTRRRVTRPTRASKLRRLDTKRQRSGLKHSRTNVPRDDD